MSTGKSTISAYTHAPMRRCTVWAVLHSTSSRSIHQRQEPGALARKRPKGLQYTGFRALSSFDAFQTSTLTRLAFLSGNRGARHHLYLDLYIIIVITTNRPPNDDSLPQQQHEPLCRNQYIMSERKKEKKKKEQGKEKIVNIGARR
jgi:hypothetical protein